MGWRNTVQQGNTVYEQDQFMMIIIMIMMNMMKGEYPFTGLSPYFYWIQVSDVVKLFSASTET